MSASLYTNLPAELRLLKQWILWKYEDIGAAKPTKVPYTSKGTLADVTKPATWSSFDDVFNASQLGNYNGIGFVFTRDDPYCFIDLDDAEGDNAILDRHLKVYHEFETYAEVSPSGKGLHLICKGKVQSGRRRSKIEIYPHDRYATMTGNVYGNRTEIVDCQSQLTQLFDQMGNGPIAQSMYNGTDKEEFSDEHIIEQAKQASNGDKFEQLYSGEWRSLYSSQSEADFALVDIIAFYSKNRVQISRIFRLSQLGKREKSKRNDYVNGMISRSFDRMLPPLDFDGLKNGVETKLAEAKTEIVNAPLANNITVPPGLLGEIAQFIYAQAPRPFPEIALAGAIGLMAGICGRAYNINGTGLNQYVLVLAKTGRGKEAAALGIDKLMAKVRPMVPTSSSFRGPGDINSGQALAKYISNTSRCFVSVIGEFGITIDRISRPDANSADKMLYKLLLDLYNKSGHEQTVQSSIYSKKEDSTNVTESPAITILGESTQKLFYAHLNEDMIAAGLLPRFLILNYDGDRVGHNEEAHLVQPHFTLVEQLAAFIAQCETVMGRNTVITVKRDDESVELLRKFDKKADFKINSAQDDVIAELWNRAHMKVLRLSALIAVGVNPYDPIVIPDYVNWAINLVQTDINILSSRFESGEIGASSSEIRQVKEIVKVIKDYCNLPYDKISGSMQFKSPQMHHDKVIPYSYINKRVSNASMFKDKIGTTNAIKRAIQTLLDTDRIKEMDKRLVNDKYGTTQKVYVIADLTIFD